MSDDAGEAMRERMGESRVRYWLLLGGNRWVVVAGLTVGLFVVLALVGAVGPSAFRSVMHSTNQVGIVFQALVSALITGVTLVVTIGQLVLSEEFGSLEDQRDDMAGAVEFRTDLEESFGSVGPPEPAAFLRWLVGLAGERAEALDELVERNRNEELREQVSRFVADLVANADAVEERLGETAFGEFELLQVAIDYNYSWKLYGIQWLRSEYRDSLSEDEREAFAALLNVHTFFGPTRGHFKSLYYQWELVRLLRAILATAIPALAVAIATLLFLAPSSFPGTTLGVDTIIWVVSAAAAVSVIPFFVLTAVVLRIATIAKRTSAIGPFVLHESDRGDDIDVE